MNSVRPLAPGLGQGVLAFLGSLGQRSEAELYLRIYQGLSRGEFALLVLSPDVLEHGTGTLAEQLRLLIDLGLVPHLLIGADEPVPDELTEWLITALGEVDLRARLVLLGEGEASVPADLGPDELLVFRMTFPSPEAFVQLCGHLTPRKTVFLRMRGGLGPHRDNPLELSRGRFLQSSRSGIGVINLRSDAEELRQSGVLDEEDARLLSLSENILRGPVGSRPRATVSVASPWGILRELFTVSGDGTLLKLGAALSVHDGNAPLERGRLTSLLEESFGRRVRPEFWERPLRRVHLESDYRGVALLEEGAGAAFLSKFAVLPVARGEGLGQDLWWSLAKADPSFYWRSRANNPINAWYAAVADGMHKTALWHVYWRGIDAAMLPMLIADAVARPEDFY